MTRLDWLSTYVTLNFLVAAAYLGFKICSQVLGYFGQIQSSQNELRVCHHAI
jgi:hypothetical protein